MRHPPARTWRPRRSAATAHTTTTPPARRADVAAAPELGTPLFELAGVSLRLGDNRVLDHIDLTVAGRGITVVVGPSGAGKSMLLRLLNRLEVPSEGEIRFRGRPLDTLDPLAL